VYILGYDAFGDYLRLFHKKGAQMIILVAVIMGDLRIEAV